MRQRSEDVDPLEMQLLDGSVQSDPPVQKETPVQEFLLCLRPMRDGHKMADESMRLVSKLNTNDKSAVPNVSSSGNESSNTSNGKRDSEKASEDTDSKNKSSTVDAKEGHIKRPPKKRPLDSQQELLKEANKFQLPKRARTQSSGGGGPEDHHIEETVIESLMLMNKN
jgi:hypothetical protein